MIEEKNVRNIFISYIPSFITGFFGGLFVIFAPYFISSIGNMTEGFFNGFLKVFPWFEKLVMANSFLLFIPYFIISLPIFLIYSIYVLTPFYKKKHPAINLKILFLSFLSFSLGLIVLFALFILVALVAFNSWRLTM